MDDAVAVELDEQVLARRLGAPSSVAPSSSAASAANRPCGLLTRTGRPAKASVSVGGEPVEGVPLRHRVRRRRPRRRLRQRRQVAGRLVVGEHRDPADVPLLAGERRWSRKTSTKRVISSTVCIRPPTEITLASLCSRASDGGLLAPDQRGADARRPCWPRSARRCRSRRSRRRGCPASAATPPRPRGGRTPGSRRGRRRRTGRGRRARGRGRASQSIRWSLSSRPAWSEPRWTRMAASLSERVSRRSRNAGDLPPSASSAASNSSGWRQKPWIMPEVRRRARPSTPAPGDPARRARSSSSAQHVVLGDLRPASAAASPSRSERSGARSGSARSVGRARRTAASTRPPRAGRARRPARRRTATPPSGRGTGRPARVAATRPGLRSAATSARLPPALSPRGDHPGQVEAEARRRGQQPRAAPCRRRRGPPGTGARAAAGSRRRAPPSPVRLASRRALASWVSRSPNTKPPPCRNDQAAARGRRTGRARRAGRARRRRPRPRPGRRPRAAPARPRRGASAAHRGDVGRRRSRGRRRSGRCAHSVQRRARPAGAGSCPAPRAGPAPRRPPTGRAW